MDNEATQQITIKPRFRKKLWLFLLSGIALIFITGTGITPAILRKIEESRDEKCKDNLIKISSALKQYAMDYADRFPNDDGMEGLGKLHKGEYIIDYSFFCCHSSKTKIARNNNISYVYFGGFIDTSSYCKGHPPHMLPVCLCPVIFDHPGNHKDHINFIDEDGRLQTIPSKAKTCSEFIEEMNNKFKYHHTILKILQEKAAEADRRYYSQEK